MCKYLLVDNRPPFYLLDAEQQLLIALWYVLFDYKSYCEVALSMKFNIWIHSENGNTLGDIVGICSTKPIFLYMGDYAQADYR